MPTITTSVDVDFDWDEVIKWHSDAAALAAAIHHAGLSRRVIDALAAEAAQANGKQLTPSEDRVDALTVLDRLVDDYVRGLPIDEPLRRIAYTHCGRVIAAIH